ncbi:MAG: hypothetical protein DRJ03_30000, partial [Chloroflexi bacterium]
IKVDPIENWLEICKPISYEAMARIVGLGGSGGDSGGGARSEGAGYGGGQDGPPDEDDIPF